VPGWTAGSLCASTKFRPYWDDPMLVSTALCFIGGLAYLTDYPAISIVYSGSKP